MMPGEQQSQGVRFDVALSFAGEQREYVEAVAEGLRDAGLSVFYDLYHEVELWGKDLYAHLDHVYREQARYCVLFLSADYAHKVWTRHERRSAQARAFREHEEYILPVRFDDTEIEGMPETIGYLSLDRRPPEQLVNAIVSKVGVRDQPRISDGLPKYFNRLDTWASDPCYQDSIEQLLAEEPDPFSDLPHSYVDHAGTDASGPAFSSLDDRDHWDYMARIVYQDFTRMTPDERAVTGAALAFGCAGELPAIVHIDPVELCRLVGMNLDEIVGHLSSVRSLGFHARRRPPVHVDEGDIIDPDAFDLTLSWWNSSVPYARDATVAAEALLAAARSGCCYEHGMERIRMCDFSDA